MTCNILKYFYIFFTHICQDSSVKQNQQDVSVRRGEGGGGGAVRSCSAPSCPALCDPTDCSPLGSFVPGNSAGKNTGGGCHALLQGDLPIQGSNPGLLSLL